LLPAVICQYLFPTVRAIKEGATGGWRKKGKAIKPYVISHILSLQRVISTRLGKEKCRRWRNYFPLTVAQEKVVTGLQMGGK
jgi:hypothetical protein